MKKALALVLVLVMAVMAFGCTAEQVQMANEAVDQAQETVTDAVENAQKPAEEAAPEAPAIKVGFIFLHDENSTYDLNFINAAIEACKALGLSEEQYILRTNVPEGQECYDTACELVEAGCSVVFADSFGHEDFMIQAAKEFPEVQFCHATGTKAHTEGLANYHNAFAQIYEGRYLAGVAAGMKLNEMIEAGKFTADEAKVGYVGAFTYAEVVSGYTSFFLGVRSECPTATMDVTFTGSWYDEAMEKEGANKLIAGGCKLISQHADSMGAPTACETAGIPNVSYNGSTKSVGPNTYIISSRINWAPYFTDCINAVVNGTEIPADYTGTLDTGSVELLELNEDVAAAGTKEKLAEVEAQLRAGTLHVFDTATFTVSFVDAATFTNTNATMDANNFVTSYMADVDTDPAYMGDTEVVMDGYFHESEFRSAPYFDIKIDGITLLDTAF